MLQASSLTNAKRFLRPWWPLAKLFKSVNITVSCFVFPNGILVINCFDLMIRAVGYVNWCPGLKLILPVPSFKVSPVTALRAMWFRIAKKPQNKIETTTTKKKPITTIKKTHWKTMIHVNIGSNDTKPATSNREEWNQTSRKAHGGGKESKRRGRLRKRHLFEQWFYISVPKVEKIKRPSTCRKPGQTESCSAMVVRVGF